jgi:hypothetical protein
MDEAKTENVCSDEDRSPRRGVMKPKDNKPAEIGTSDTDTKASAAAHGTYEQTARTQR